MCQVGEPLEGRRVCCVSADQLLTESHPDNKADLLQACWQVQMKPLLNHDVFLNLTK